MTKKLAIFALLFASSAALADEVPTPPTPPVPVPEDDVKEYSGVGSNVAYTRAGVVELGGSFAFNGSGDITTVSADPSIGYFLFDNIQASAILGTRVTNLDGETASRFSLVLEPSLHYPFTKTFFGFVGVGGGLATAGGNAQDFRVGGALAPRVGVKFLVGRSGLINVGARQVISFIDADTNYTPYGGNALLAFTNTFDAQVGYTVMF